jgi:hypothetical protein
MKVQVIRIYGYTKNPLTPHGHNPTPVDEDALVLPKDLSDSMRDEVISELRSCGYAVGYIFNEGDRILGENSSMIVISYRFLEELEMGAVQ